MAKTPPYDPKRHEVPTPDPTARILQRTLTPEEQRELHERRARAMENDPVASSLAPSPPSDPRDDPEPFVEVDIKRDEGDQPFAFVLTETTHIIVPGLTAQVTMDKLVRAIQEGTPYRAVVMKRAQTIAFLGKL